MMCIFEAGDVNGDLFLSRRELVKVVRGDTMQNEKSYMARLLGIHDRFLQDGNARAAFENLLGAWKMRIFTKTKKYLKHEAIFL